MEKKLIYDSESFGNVIKEISEHIDNIKDCFNDTFTIESYEGSSKDKMELAFQNILNSMSKFANNLDNIPEILNNYKTKYDEISSRITYSVNGGDHNV